MATDMTDTTAMIDELLGDEESMCCPDHPEANVSRGGASYVAFDSEARTLTCVICGRALEVPHEGS